MVCFNYFRPLWSVFSGFWADSREDNAVLRKYCQSMFYSYVRIYVSYLSVIFIGLGSFPQVLGQIKDGLY